MTPITRKGYRVSDGAMHFYFVDVLNPCSHQQWLGRLSSTACSNAWSDESPNQPRVFGYAVWGRLHVPLTRDNGSLGLVPRGYHPPGLVTQSGVRDDDEPLVSPPRSRSFLLMVADSL